MSKQIECDECHGTGEMFGSFMCMACGGKGYTTENENTEAYQFREVMAVMLSDGGQYLEEHGPKKAANEAIKKYYKMVEALEMTTPYPGHCQNPLKCAGKGLCQNNPNCIE